MARSTAATALGAALLLALHPSGADAQRRFTPPRWQAELGATVGATPYVEDAGGARVTGGIGPSVGVAALWSAGAATTVEIGARLARLPVRVEAPGGEWDAEAAVHADLLAAIGWSPVPRLTLRGALGLSRLTGDDRIVPFRAGNESPWHPAAEIGAAWRVTPRLAVSAAAHATRIGEATAGDPTEAGAMTRLIVGVRHGR